jgi:hypothetical protein
VIWYCRLGILAIGWFLVIRNVVWIISDRYPLTPLPIVLHVTMTLCVAVLSWLTGMEADRRRRARRANRPPKPDPAAQARELLLVPLNDADREWFKEQMRLAGQLAVDYSPKRDD